MWQRKLQPIILKNCSCNVYEEGSLAEGLAVTNISVEPREVTIAGPKDILDNIQSLEGVEVDLSQLTESTTFDASVLLPKGVTSAKPNQVKVSVGVQKQNKRKQKRLMVSQSRKMDFLKMLLLSYFRRKMER